MRPSLARTNQAYECSANAEPLGDVSLKSGGRLDFPHLSLGEFGAADGLAPRGDHSKNAVPVNQVLAQREVFQIAHVVVLLVSVFVVYLKPVGAWSHERLHHKAMNQRVRLYPVPNAEASHHIAATLDAGRYALADMRPLPAPNATDATPVAHVIPALKPDDRPPLFGMVAHNGIIGA